MKRISGVWTICLLVLMLTLFAGADLGWSGGKKKVELDSVEYNCAESFKVKLGIPIDDQNWHTKFVKVTGKDLEEKFGENESQIVAFEYQNNETGQYARFHVFLVKNYCGQKNVIQFMEEQAKWFNDHFMDFKEPTPPNFKDCKKISQPTQGKIGNGMLGQGKLGGKGQYFEMLGTPKDNKVALYVKVVAVPVKSDLFFYNKILNGTAYLSEKEDAKQLREVMDTIEKSVEFVSTK